MQHLSFAGMVSAMRKAAVSVLFLLIKSRCRGPLGFSKMPVCVVRRKPWPAHRLAACPLVDDRHGQSYAKKAKFPREARWKWG